LECHVPSWQVLPDAAMVGGPVSASSGSSSADLQWRPGRLTGSSGTCAGHSRRWWPPPTSSTRGPGRPCPRRSACKCEARAGGPAGPYAWWSAGQGASTRCYLQRCFELQDLCVDEMLNGDCPDLRGSNPKTKQEIPVQLGGQLGGQ
jgi:hypothetical protein